MRLLVSIWLLGCGNDVGIAKQATCDGALQGQEETVDSPFDADHDGFFDGSNAGCQAAYGAASLDCDDGDPAVNPGSAELSCDGVDNDCDAATEDAPDADEDGVTACDDCDDADAEAHGGVGVDEDGDGFDLCTDCDDARMEVNPNATETTCNDLDDDCNAASEDGADADADGFSQCDECDDLDPYAYPGNTEVCDNGADDNCDGQIDEDCLADYTGDWDLDTRVTLYCAIGFVDVDFDYLEITDRNPVIRVYAEGPNSQPGTMTGTLTSATEFEAENVISGGCTETYSITGTFTSETTFEGTFSAAFSGGRANCMDCAAQSWTVVGTRR